MGEKHEIRAVHENNLGKMLKELGMLDDVREGRIQCRFCGKNVTLENLGCLYPKNNAISVCCDDSKCFVQAIQDSRGE